jgi:hypothetical protein
MDLEVAEAKLLRKLEKSIRAMFSYTGWDEDCDEEPAITVKRVEKALKDLDAFRQARSAISAGETNG